MFLLDTVDSFQCIVLNTQNYQFHILISFHDFLFSFDKNLPNSIFASFDETVSAPRADSRAQFRVIFKDWLGIQLCCSKNRGMDGPNNFLKEEGEVAMAHPQNRLAKT